MKPRPTALWVIMFALCVGCNRPDATAVKSNQPFELYTASNGLIYRLNKVSGEVNLIVGAQISKVDEPLTTNKEEPIRNYVKYWPTTTNSSLGNLQLTMKTNWREGSMYYVFAVAPYAGRIEAEREKSAPTATFMITVYDGDGFQLMALPARIGEMTKTVDDSGKPTSLTLNTTTQCSQQIYEAIRKWSVGWVGFSD